MERWKGTESRHIPHQHPQSVVFLPKVEQILARREAPSATFRPAPADDPKHANLLRTGPCVICSDTPSVVSRNGVTVYPLVHEVRFGIGIPQYICDGCVQARNPLAIGMLGDQLATASTKH